MLVYASDYGINGGGNMLEGWSSRRVLAFSSLVLLLSCLLVQASHGVRNMCHAVLSLCCAV